MISKILEPVLNIFRFHKFKLLVLSICYLIFLYLLFPFNDLGDLVAAKISQLTQGQIFVDFDKLDLSLVPQPALELTNVNVETPFTPALTAKSLSVAPSVAGLLSFKPGVSVRAEDFLGGDLDLSTRGGDKTPGGTRRQKINAEFTSLSMSSLAKIGNWPLKLEGSLSGTMDSQIDPSFAEQPEGDINLQIAKTVIPEGNVITPFGPFPIPRLNINDISVEAKAEKGTFEVSKFIFGKAGSDLIGNVTGHVDLKLQRYGQSMTTSMGGYDFSIHLQVSDLFKQKFGSYLSVLQDYQSGNNSYAFRAYGVNAFSPPNLTRIQ